MKRSPRRKPLVLDDVALSSLVSELAGAREGALVGPVFWLIAHGVPEATVSWALRAAGKGRRR